MTQKVRANDTDKVWRMGESKVILQKIFEKIWDYLEEVKVVA